MSDEFFTRADWRPSKKRKMQKRLKPWGGRKTAPPAFLEAAKRTYFQPGKRTQATSPNHRICHGTRNGKPCPYLALKGLTVCGSHGGYSVWARQGKLQPTGRTAAAKARRAAAVEAKCPIVPQDLIRLQIYQSADQWTRTRLAEAYHQPQAWHALIRQLKQRQENAPSVCV